MIEIREKDLSVFNTKNDIKVSFGAFALTILTENQSISLTCEQLDKVVVEYFRQVNEETISEILEQSGFFLHNVDASADYLDKLGE